MMETSARLYLLNFDEVRTYLWAAVFVACNMVLPQVAHLVPQGGVVFAPLSLVVIVGACKLGWKTGLLAAVLSPLVNNLVFGMPAWGVLPVMAVKLAVLAVVAGMMVQRMGRVAVPVLVCAVLMGELLGGVAEWALTGSVAATVADFCVGWPGLLLQTVGGWLIVNCLWTK